MIHQCVVGLTVTLSASAATAQITEFTNSQAWEIAVGGNFSTIDFTRFPNGTVIGNQYEDLGVTFVGQNFISVSAIHVNDNSGLFGPAGVRMTFASPQNWVSIDHPGVAMFQLFSDGQLIYTSSLFDQGDVGNFAGLVSTQSFNEVYVFKPPPFANQVGIDDLHWGSAVPAPGAAGLIVAFVLGRRRRRT